MSNSVSAGRPGLRDLKSSPYAHGVGAAVLAAVGAMSIMWCTTSTTLSNRLATIAILGVGQALVFWLASDLPFGYRAVSSVALLSAFLAAFVPGLFQATPVSTGAALTLAAAGSLPMWAVAVWRLALARQATRRT